MSSYQVIARRYRPSLFDDVVGQEHVTQVLAGAIASERVAHAYLFSGPRGVGKTSTARILARALNCEQGPTPTPCNSCTLCQEIAGGRHLDTIEIDGASTRGIDSVRELRENVRYAPASGRRKVYVIDEVHMLTSEAFNALLKTLEEPPSHVVFIFATTEPQKVPATILSRCQRFDFRLLGVQEIADQLEKIAKAEKFKVDRAALMVVARRGQGSMRDAESLLDQILVAVDKRKKVGRDAVERLLGLTSADTFLKLTDSLHRQDAAAALTVLDESLAAGAHLDELAAGLLEHLRNLMLLAVSADLAPTTGLGADLIERMMEQLAGWSRGDLARMLELTAEAVGQMRRSDFPRFHLEMVLVQMSELPATVDLRRLLDRLEGEGGEGGAPPGGAASGGGSTGRSRTGRHATGTASGRPAGGGGGERSRLHTEAESLVARSPAPAAPADPSPAEPRIAVPAPPPPAATEIPAAAPPTSAEMLPAAPPVAVEFPPAPPAALRAPAPPTVAPDPLVSSSPSSRAADMPARRSAASIQPAWARVVDRLKTRKAYLASLLAEAQDPRLEQGLFRLSFASDQVFHRDQVRDVRNRELLIEELRTEFGAGIRFEVTEVGTSQAAPADPEPAPAPIVPLQYSNEVEQLMSRMDGVILPDA